MEQENVIRQENPRTGVHVLISLSVYIGLYFFLSMVLSVAAYLGLGLSGVHGSYTLSQYAVIQIASLLASVLPALFVLKYCDSRPFSDLGLSIRGRWKDFLYGLLVAVLLYGIGFGLSLVLGEVRIMGVHLSFTNLAGSFGVCILVALTEEIMIRGYVLGRLLRTRLNKFLSLLISSVLFSLMHLFNPNVAFLPMLNLVLAGCLLGAAFLYTRNLWFPISLRSEEHTSELQSRE